MKFVPRLLIFFMGLACFPPAALPEGQVPPPGAEAAAEPVTEQAQAWTTPPADQTAAVRYKEKDAVSTGQITTGYVVLMVVLVVAIGLLTVLRKYLAQRLQSPPQGERLALLEKMRIGRQTHATLLEVEGRKILVVENPHGLAVNRVDEDQRDHPS